MAAITPSFSGSFSLSSSTMLTKVNEKVLQDLVTQLFNKFRQELSESSFHYRANTHDFGIQIKTLLFNRPTDLSVIKKYFEKYGKYPDDMGGIVDHFVKNMQVIANREGFSLRLSTTRFFARDSFIRLPDGTFALPAASKNIPIAIERTQSRALVRQATSAYRTNHLFFRVGIGTALRDHDQAVDDFKEMFKTTPAKLPFYIEGGNYFLASTAEGTLKLFLGEDIFFIALNQLRLDKGFDEQEINKNKAIIESTLTKEIIENSLSEMYSQGLLKSKTGCEKGLITSSEIEKIIFLVLNSKFDFNQNINFDLSVASKLKMYEPLNLTEEQIQSAKSLVSIYLAQKQATKNLIAKSFSVTSEDCHLIPQVGYHLDTFMRPGPKGSFFVQDYAVCNDLLKAFLDKATELELTKKDLEMIHRYLNTSQLFEKKLASLFEQIKTELKQGGFPVIPTPGIFYDTSPHLLSKKIQDAKTFNVNFLNAITGWSSKTDSYYYIASGAQVGDKLGMLLMKTYQQFLESYQEGIHVYYIGCHPDHPADFSEAMSWWNSLNGQAGPHCLSIELETQLAPLNHT